MVLAQKQGKDVDVVFPRLRPIHEETAPGALPPEAYLAQLAAYRAALQGIYPGRPVRAQILWTAAPRVDDVESALLDRALDALMGAV